MENLKAHSHATRLFYFWSGIIATLAYRIIIVLNAYDPVWVQVAWYIGTIGFVVYFIHRYDISEKRGRIIQERGLEEKVAAIKGLSKDDKAAMAYIFHTLQSSKEKWNYIFIFALSALALIAGVVMDFVL